jgi:ABC-type lipoprotein release transport system permease subunit
MLTLAWRNLWRQRRRSLVTAGALALVVMLTLIYYGIAGASVNSFYQNVTETSGHIHVNPQGYRDTREFDRRLIRHADALRGVLHTEAPEALTVGVLEVPGLLSGDVRSRGILLVGRDWPEPLREAYLSDNLSAGRFIEAGELDAIVLGEALAQALGVDLGDAVYAYTPGTEGFGAAAYTVVGLISLLDSTAEVQTAHISLAAAQELAAPESVTRFELYYPELRRLVDDTLATETSSRLAATLTGYQVESWRELDPMLLELVNSIGPLTLVVTAIFFILAGLLVVNTIYLSLMERIREFGVIISLGASGRKVMRMITLESVLICLLGATVGLIVGLLIVAQLSQGFVFPGLEAYYASFGMNPVFYATVSPAQVVTAFSFAVVTGILAALWPASIAARLEPVEAMRFTA